MKFFQVLFSAIFLTICAAKPTRRSFEFEPAWWASSGGMAGSGTFLGPFGGFMSAFNPFAAFQPFFFKPLHFDFDIFKPWYKGPNVCIDERTIKEEPDEFDEFDDEFSNYQQESQSCRGTSSKVVCKKRVTTENGVKVSITTYQCCHGFVRSNDGRPGCVETVLTTKEPPEPFSSSYGFFPGEEKKTDAIDRVPLQ